MYISIAMIPFDFSNETHVEIVNSTDETHKGEFFDQMVNDFTREHSEELIEKLNFENWPKLRENEIDPIVFIEYGDSISTLNFDVPLEFISIQDVEFTVDESTPGHFHIVANLDNQPMRHEAEDYIREYVLTNEITLGGINYDEWSAFKAVDPIAAEVFLVNAMDELGLEIY